MLQIVCFLKLASAMRFLDSGLHRIGHSVCIQNHFGVGVSSRSTDGLNERGFASQKPFFVGVQDRDQGNFRQIEPLTQQVDTNQDIAPTLAQFTQKVDSFKCIQFAMQPTTL